MTDLHYYGIEIEFNTKLLNNQAADAYLEDYEMICRDYVKEGRINDFGDLKHSLGKSRGKSLYPISIDENGAIVLSIGYDRFKANYQKPKLEANGFISIPILNKYVLGFLQDHIDNSSTDDEHAVLVDISPHLVPKGQGHQYYLSSSSDDWLWKFS